MKQKSYYKIIALSVLAGLLATTLFESDMFSGKDTVSLEQGLNVAEKGGQNKAAIACNTCHGQSGEGNSETVTPRLAGLGYQ